VVSDRFDEPGTSAKVMLAGVGLIIIFLCLISIVKLMRSLVLDRLQSLLSNALDKSIIVGLIAGALLTVAAQSSSITTSVMVPLAGAGLITLRQTMPLVLGANVGTTITALIAAVAVVGDQAMAARQIALVHLLFNLTGIILLYSIPRAVDVPIGMAQRLAVVADRSKRWAFVYIVGMFYGFPAALFFLSKAFL
jgi:sodium-dependent phosphate cotransporter